MAGKRVSTRNGCASDAGPNVLGHPRVHDADLCERIRDLEQEVERLKADRHHCYGHWHWSPPYWTSPTYYPTFTVNGTTTTGKIYTSNTVSFND